MAKQKQDIDCPRINFFSELEKQVIEFWDKNKIFEKSVDKKAPRGDYVFYDGPPFATGLPHYGHIVASIIKDVVPRYFTMQGFRVERKWGWDCHGLPIENIVEKELGTKNKKEIEEIGVAEFNEMCRSKVLAFAEDWKDYMKKLGRWADMENSYKTMDKDFMESVWWVFKQLWENGLIYKGYRSMHICPRCETTLSQSEVAEGYRDIKDLSCTVKFKLVAHNLKPVTHGDVYVLAWTTTPWTLIGNVALAVGRDIDYAIFEKIGESKDDVLKGEKIIFAEGDIGSSGDVTYFRIFGKDYYTEKNGKIIAQNGDKYERKGTIKGKDLVGLEYEPLFDYYAQDKNLKNRDHGWKIYAADFVTTEEGTGIVHIAPAFGDDDMKLGEKHNLPFVQHVAMDGGIKPEAVDFAGMNVKPAGDTQKTDVEIIKYLAEKDLLFAKEKYEHSYPHCWRCDTPLLNYATSSWFVNVLKIKDDFLKHAEAINWSPEHIKRGRWGKWLEGARDWSISRQRFWASVLPIWECACGERKVIGSIKELEDLSGKKVNDLHKHVVDEIAFPCPECGGAMKRVPDVLDCWFESGSMPYAQMHYPFENKERFENNFPAEFIAEGTDQTRCWFYYLHILAEGVMKTNAFKNVIVNGIVLAEDGKKMSKKLQNYPDPMEIFDKYSADALRYYLLTSPVMLADNLCFSEQGVNEALRKICMLVWNVYKFYEMYADEKSKCKNQNAKINSGNILDQWILARLNRLISEVTDNMDNYNLPKATRPIQEFIDDLSTWYIRRSRDRFKGSEKQDGQAARETTGYVLLQLSKVLAPFTPFIAEQVWQKVSGNNFKDKNKSVHLEEWPEHETGSTKQETGVINKMEIARKIVELGLAKRDEAGIKVRQPLVKLEVRSKNLELNDKYTQLIKDEVNVKEVIIDSGKNEAIQVELDTEITPELKQEGMKREIVRLINNMRKNTGMTIQDRAIIYWESDNEEIKQVFDKFGKEIKQDTLSAKIINGISEKPKNKKRLEVNGEAIELDIEKA